MNDPGADPDLQRLAARPPSRTADAVSTLLDPAVVLSAGVLVVAARTDNPLGALGWAVLTLVFLVGVPWAVLALLLGSGRVGDRQVVRRAQRHVVMWPAAASVLVGLVLLTVLRAPAELVELVAAVLLGAVVVSSVTLLWKASVHTAVLAAVATVLSLQQGAAGSGAAVGDVAVGSVAFGVVALGALALLGWARWRAGRHTVAQVVVGAVLGASTAAAVVRWGP